MPGTQERMGSPGGSWERFVDRVGSVCGRSSRQRYPSGSHLGVNRTPWFMAGAVKAREELRPTRGMCGLRSPGSGDWGGRSSCGWSLEGPGLQLLPPFPPTSLQLLPPQLVRWQLPLRGSSSESALSFPALPGEGGDGGEESRDVRIERTFAPPLQLPGHTTWGKTSLHKP